MTTSGFDLGRVDDTPISEDTPDAWGDLVDEFDDSTNGEEDILDNDETIVSEEDETPPEGDEAVSEEDEIVAEETEEEPAEESEEDDTTGDEEVEGLLDIPPPEENEEEAPIPQVQEDANVQREKFHSQLKEVYAISEEDLERFDENPGDVLPEFAANLHMKIVENVMNQFQQILPDAVQQITQVSSVERESENAFFEAWPELEAHGTVVSQVAQQFRQMNPKASTEEAIKAVGVNALYQLGVDPAEVAQRVAGTYQRAPAEPATPKPHTPAGIGRTSSRGEEAAPNPTLWDEMIS